MKKDRKALKVAYGKTPLGQLIFDLGFTRLQERYLARKHAAPIADIRRLRKIVRKGLRDGRQENRERHARRA